MNKEQVGIIKQFDGNYGISVLPGLVEQPKATYYRWDANMQTVIPMPDLPSDPASLKSYLSRGFGITAESVKPKENPEVTVIEQKPRKQPKKKGG